MSLNISNFSCKFPMINSDSVYPVFSDLYHTCPKITKTTNCVKMQKRQNSGYTSVGHLLANQEPTEITKTLRTLLSSLCEDKIMKDLIDPAQASWKWEEYCKSSCNLNMHTFAAFLDGMLRKPGTDPLLMQIRIELLVWKKLQQFKKDSENYSYKVFTIFNRFCRVEDLPLEMGPHETNYLLQRLNPTEEKTIRKFLSLEQFLKLFQNVDRKILDKYYDEVVLDIVISDNVQARVYHKK